LSQRTRGARPRLTLLARFTLVAAGAVAVTALVITAVAFVAIRGDLENQVHQQLAQRAANVTREAARFHGHIPVHWIPSHSTQFGSSAPYTQVITADGGIWAPASDAGLLIPNATALSVAAGKLSYYYQDTSIGGVPATVLTTPLGGRDRLALQVAVPLNVTSREVGTVGTVLAVLSGIGIVIAAGLGWAVARTGLAPVARLAAVAERVSATGDPDQRVQVGRGDELGRLAMSFNRMLAALRRSLATQRQLISDASHELRTPLASLRVNVELLAEESEMPEAERKEVLSRVVAQVAELSDLVASVTQLARGEQPRERHAAVRLDDVVGAALEAARRDWPETEFRAALDEVEVTGDAERIRVAVRNLLDNAAKFGPPRGPVEVSVRRGQPDGQAAGGPHGVLTVRDHGPGIDLADAPFVFDRFYRAPSSRAVPGSGLGLSVVSDVVHAHGGTVGAEPARGGGTLMRLAIPAA
jgi:two-component system sensor histidine kinase MprB